MARSYDSKWIDRLAEEARILGEARMLRDDQPLTDDLKAAVIQRLKQHLQHTGITDGRAARSMGIAATTLSQVLSGKYPADDERFIRAIDKWVERQIAKQAAPKDAGFVRTEVAKQIYGVAKWIVNINAIGLVTGPSGIGKTRTLKAIRSDFPGSIYVSITRAGQSTLSVLDQIASELRLGNLKLTSWQLHQAIVGTIRDSERLIIVDEVHRLVGRRNDEALHALRDLHDQTGTTPERCCPMLWAGMHNIADYIDTNKSRYEALEQIDGRIKYRLNLTELANEVHDGGPGLFTIDDIRKFLAAQQVRVTPDAEAYLLKIAREPKMGALRTVDGLVKFAREFARDRQIDAPMLRSIFVQQRGHKFVEAFEHRAEIMAAAATAAG